ncbi:MAG: osmotically inducible protein OsmC [Desulfuromonadaceae bacterium]|nr:osmotically inducible protein OsmC [Desulfuromonadaceae bacterium]
MEITFPGGVAVEASFDGFTVRTDQPLSRGGENSAPTPFDLFLASLGTCTGFFAWRFCQERGLSTEGLRVTLETEKDAQMHRLTRISIVIHLPAGFPDKYRQAIVLAANQCSVKKAILDPPEFEVLTR